MKLAPRITRHTTATAAPVDAARRPRLLRLRARLSGWRLDRELAAGMPIALSPLQEARARRLVGRDVRRQLAGSLRRAVEMSGLPSGFSPVVAADPRVIDGWADGLLGIADRLEQSQPVGACAVARVRLLVCDGTGPLYNDAHERSLGEAIWSIADALQEPCPPHDWRCPVITKLEPGRIAWTCAGCGAVGYSPHLGRRPD
jgi:hypothetical protein